MTAQLRFELLKLRTLRSTWVAVAASVASSAALAILFVQSSAADGIALTAAQTALLPAQVMWFVGIAVAVLGTTGEFAHRTIRSTLLLTPSRSRVALAKAVVAAGSGALFVLVGGGVAAIAAIVAAAARGGSIPLGGPNEWWPIAVAAGIGALWSVIAVAVGMLTRSAAIAVTSVLLWRFVGENMLPGLAGRPDLVVRWMPFAASNAILGGPGLPSAWAALLLLAYAAFVALLAVRFFGRADVS
jgi:ABC-2 type transport system permease protein